MSFTDFREIAQKGGRQFAFAAKFEIMFDLCVSGLLRA